MQDSSIHNVRIQGDRETGGADVGHTRFRGNESCLEYCILNAGMDALCDRRPLDSIRDRQNSYGNPMESPLEKIEKRTSAR